MAESSDLQNVSQGLLSNLVPGRDCGDCVACCKTMQINDDDLQKRAGILCRHNTGSGCGIYQTRPDVCRGWFCLWRRMPSLPDAARPDRSGVIISLNLEERSRNCFERIYFMVHATNSDDDFEGEAAKAAIQMLIDQGCIPVWLGADDTKTLIHPRPEIAQLVLSGKGPPDHLAKEVGNWLARFS